MVSAFDKAFDRLILVEGGYARSKKDLGGPTMWGITERVARLNGYKGEMSEMPIETGKAIAKTQYWDLLNLDRVAALSEPIANEMFDTYYNTGIGGQFLQRALNVFNHEAKDYPDLAVDALVGPATLSALKAYLAKRPKDGETTLLKALNCLQGARYVEITEARVLNEEYCYGWFRGRIEIPGI